MHIHILKIIINKIKCNNNKRRKVLGDGGPLLMWATEELIHLKREIFPSVDQLYIYIRIRVKSSLPRNLDTFSLGPGTLAPCSHTV